MSWPLGYGMPTLRFHASLDGVIHANDVPVTESGGWLDLPVPDDVRTFEGPDEYSLRIRLSVDAAGNPFLYAEEVELGGRRFAGLYALAKSRGSAWLSAPVTQVRAAIEARVAAARAERRGPTAPPAARVRTITSPAAPTSSAWPGADDTWDHRVRDPRAMGE